MSHVNTGKASGTPSHFVRVLSKAWPIRIQYLNNSNDYLQQLKQKHALQWRENLEMAKKKFIQKAVSGGKGDLTRKAKNKGQTVNQFCADVGPKASTRTKRQCALAKTLSKLRPKKK